MLTNHNYKKSSVNIETGSDIFNCCRSETPDDPKCTDCCYDTWRDELKDVVKKYAEKQEQAQLLQKRLSFIVDRRNKFKTWLDELNKAEELARKICGQLDVIASQSDKIWFNACYAVQAIEILFCMLRDFYSQTDYLKSRYDVLRKCIDNNNNPVLVKDQGILKCLNEYYDKLAAVIKTRDDIVKAIVEAIRVSNLLRNHINTTNCQVKKCPPNGTQDNTPIYNPCAPDNKPCDCDDDAGKEPYYGFKAIICEWFCAFGCNNDCGPDEDPCAGKDDPCKEAVGQPKQGAAQTKQTTPPSNPQPGPCKDYVCDLEPMFGFPICRNEYKCCIAKRYKDDDACVKQLESDLKEANKEKESLLACKQSLDKAIAEVDPKTRCK